MVHLMSIFVKQFICFISQAITWLKELCNVMITSNMNVGRTYEESGRMKTDHEKFQSTAKV